MELTRKTISDMAKAYGVEVEFDSKNYRDDEINIATTDGNEFGFRNSMI